MPDSHKFQNDFQTLKKNVMSTTFSQQILSGILLLVITYY